jgi:hypothetical protein
LGLQTSATEIIFDRSILSSDDNMEQYSHRPQVIVNCSYLEYPIRPFHFSNYQIESESTNKAKVVQIVHKFRNPVSESNEKANMANTMTGPPTTIPVHNDRVVQRARGGGVPLRVVELIQRQYGHFGPEEVESILTMDNYRVRTRSRIEVNASRNEAIARGVHIVYHESLPEHYVLEELPDE